MNNAILVLGAGASYGARYGADDRPPLGPELPSFLLRWFEGHADDKRFFGDPPREGTPSDFYWKMIVGADPKVAVGAFLEDAVSDARGFEAAMARLLQSPDLHAGVVQEVTRLLSLALLSGTGGSIVTRADL